MDAYCQLKFPTGKTNAMAMMRASFSPLLPAAIASPAGSRVRECKIIQFGRPNLHLPSVRKEYADFRPQQRQRRVNLQVANAASEACENEQLGPEGLSQIINGKSLAATFDIFLRFSRMFAIKASIFLVVSNCLLAVQSTSDLTPALLIGILQAVIGACAAGLFVIGLNQVADIEIDKVNKPYLPLSSGELSLTTAYLILASYAVLGFCLGWYTRSWPLRLLILSYFAFGVGYSINLPLLRWKGTSPKAVISNCINYGLFIPILSYLHVQVGIFGRPPILTKHVVFSASLFTLLTMSIMIFKDLSDVEGDVKNGVVTFASQFGPKRIFWLCIWIFEAVFGMSIAIGLSSPNPWIRSLMVVAHAILGFILWKEANTVDLTSKTQFESFYMLIWKIMTVEYMLVPILRF